MTISWLRSLFCLPSFLTLIFLETYSIHLAKFWLFPLSPQLHLFWIQSQAGLLISKKASEVHLLETKLPKVRLFPDDFFLCLVPSTFWLFVPF
jgi:hypothetical protein